MIDTQQFAGKKIAVLGAGVEGISSAQFLVKHGATVTLRDQKKEIPETLLHELQRAHITFFGGEDYLDHLTEYDIVVRSPGIKRNTPALVAAEEKGVHITSLTKLFFKLCPAPIIGVTGTKGKGTTASLIYEMLKAEGLDVHLGGNIGVSPFSFLEKLTNQSWVVLELSSFQLQDLDQSPHIAVMLMITSEHMDYHGSLEEYIDAKRNLVRWQTPHDYAVLNRDYPATHESDIYTDGKIYQVSREREAFGDGCYVLAGAVRIRREGKEEILLETSEILLPGKHNLENICAAVMAALLAGVSKKSITAVLTTFKGLEHRLELVREVDGVRYYDDSFSTTPETAIAAIEAFDVPEIVILGGSSKQSDFTELGQLLSTRVNIKAIIGIGKEWPRIKEKMRSTNSELLIIEGCENMEEVVDEAAGIAAPGDVVLLSPACASFDMFKNYKARGEQFKDAVTQL